MDPSPLDHQDAAEVYLALALMRQLMDVPVTADLPRLDPRSLGHHALAVPLSRDSHLAALAPRVASLARNLPVDKGTLATSLAHPDAQAFLRRGDSMELAEPAELVAAEPMVALALFVALGPGYGCQEAVALAPLLLGHDPNPREETVLLGSVALASWNLLTEVRSPSPDLTARLADQTARYLQGVERALTSLGDQRP